MKYPDFDSTPTDAARRGSLLDKSQESDWTPQCLGSTDLSALRLGHGWIFHSKPL